MLNTRDKKQKEVAIYIFIVIVSFTVIAVGDFIIRSFIFAQLTLEVAFATDLRS